eukprot:m.447108 g.447108  ORF g.447108 m.447108 type:complete len:104 (+) comp20314_c0_seq1:72-383(+)
MGTLIENKQKKNLLRGLNATLPHGPPHNKSTPSLTHHCFDGEEIAKRPLRVVWSGVPGGGVSAALEGCEEAGVSSGDDSTTCSLSWWLNMRRKNPPGPPWWWW